MTKARGETEVEVAKIEVLAKVEAHDSEGVTVCFTVVDTGIGIERGPVAIHKVEYAPRPGPGRMQADQPSPAAR